MKIYTTVEPVPSRMLALARLLFVAGPLSEEELVALLQPREDTGMAKKTLDAAVECRLVLREKRVCRLAIDLFPPAVKASELDELLPIIMARLLLIQKVAGEPNGFATICAWLLHQPVNEVPAEAARLIDAPKDQGLSLDELQANSRARWANIIYWARYIGLARQTRDEECAGVLPDPTLYLRRHLKELLPEGEDVEAATFRCALGVLCPVLDGGAVRATLLESIAPDWPSQRLSDALTFAIERLERAGEAHAWCPDDQRTFLLTPAGRKIAYLARSK